MEQNTGFFHLTVATIFLVYSVPVALTVTNNKIRWGELMNIYLTSTHVFLPSKTDGS